MAVGGVHISGSVCLGRARRRVCTPRGGTAQKSILVVDVRCVVVVVGMFEQTTGVLVVVLGVSHTK